MRYFPIFTLSLATSTLIAAERMNVSVCNMGRIGDSLIAQAETEAANAFRAVGIEVVWAKCGDEVGAQASDSESRFVIRLRSDRPPEAWGPVSLDAMGRAYVLAPGEGRIADVFFKAVREYSDQNSVDLRGLLGYVIVHEIGHLLLGPGHSSRGIMHSPWRGPDRMALERRWLKFTSAQQAEIVRKLRSINQEQADPVQLGK